MSVWNNIAGRPWIVLGAGVLIAGGVMATALSDRSPIVSGPRSPLAVQPASVLTPAPSNSAAFATLQALDQAFAEISSTAGQGVVHIRTGQQPNGRIVMGGGEGSGFIYRPDGWIVTNDHVVQNFDEVTVILADGREFKGKVRRANDPQLDLAIVKIDATNLPTLPLAESDSVRPGQYAIAMGAPFGLENTVTVGHISAVGRSGQVMDEQGGRAYSGMIQTDASINPGNSGGPLLNIEGQVIGVNTSIYSTSGANAGIGFSIPSDIVRVVADELISTGKFARGLMGVTPEDLKPFQRKEKNLPGGALVSEVQPASPAANAGIQAQDVIVRIGETPVLNEVDLRVAMYKHNPGETVSVQYLRGTQTRTAQVKLIAPPTETARTAPRRMPEGMPEGMPDLPFNIPDFPGMPNQPRNPEAPSAPREGKPRLGVTVQAIDATMRSQFGIPAGTTGVVVVAVESGSFASRFGFKPGDVITKVEETSVNSPTDLQNAMASVQWGDTVSVTFRRFQDGGQQQMTIVVPLQ